MVKTWKQNNISVNQQQLHVTRAGSPGLPALVLVHGFSDNGLCWRATALDLEERYDVIMPDARGHGHSVRIARGEIIDMVNDLHEVIQRLGVEAPIIAGHSMGGLVAAGYGARYPNNTRALILEDPAWWTPAPDHPAPRELSEGSLMDAWIHQLQAQPLDDVIADSRVEHPTWSEDVLQHWCEGKQQLDAMFFTAHDAIWDQDWQDQVRQIRCPTLLVTADVELNGIVTPAMVQQAIELNPLIREAHIAGASHHIRFDHYAQYMAAVTQFLNSL